MEVLEQRAKEKHSAGLEVLTDQNVIQYHVKVSPDKRYQRLNASLAIALADTYLRAEDRNFSMTDDIARGLEDAVLLGRCQVVKDKDVTWFISVAHNKDSLRETVSWFKGCVITR
jgi:folylpolyglutamate synthase